MLRRQKDVVEIPPLEEEDVWLHMYTEERERYDTLEHAARKTCNALISSDIHKNEYKRILRILVRLRQECGHTCLKLGYNTTSKIGNYTLLLSLIRKK